MKWQSLKIRQKLFVGFGTILFVTAFLGIILLTGLFNINKSSRSLYNEKIPELSKTYELQSHWQMAVFNLRSYSSSKKEQYYTMASHHLGKVEEILDSLINATTGNDISKWYSLEQELYSFREQTDQSFQAALQVENSYKTLDSAQTELQKLSDNYLNLQYQKLKSDVDKSEADYIIKRRVDKISLMNEIVSIAENLKITIGETNYRDEPALLNSLAPSFDIIRMNVEEILPMTTKKYDIEALNEILHQNKLCEESLENLRKNWLAYRQLNNHDFLERGLSLTNTRARQQEAHLTKSALSNLQHAKNARNTWWWSIILSLLTGTFLAWLISKSLSDPLLKLTNLAALQADGILVSIPETSRKDEVGILTQSMKSHQEQTARIVDGLSSTSRSLNDVIERLKNRSQHLTETTTSQASSSEEITAAVEEMQALTQSGSSEASKAASELLKAGTDVNQYIAENHEAINHMQLLIDRSTIISELASQTYILSVNASVEAARDDSKNNKGFATIAKAMRELAERVKNASDEINILTEKGTKTSGKAISNLDSINKIITQNGDVLQNLAAMSKQQNSEVAQISGTIQQLNMETRNTSRMAEAMAEEAERLEEQANELQNMLNFYRKEKTEENNLPEINQWEWAELFAREEDEDIDPNKNIQAVEEIVSQ